MLIEKPHFPTFIAGLICVGVSPFLAVSVIQPLFDISTDFSAPIAFGLALVIPNLLNLVGIKSKIIAVLIFPIISIIVLALNMFLTTTLAAAITDETNATIGMAFIGLYSGLIMFAAFNFFFNRKIKFANYGIVGITGIVAFSIVGKVIDDGLIDNFDKLIYIWQWLVGVGITLSYRKEQLRIIFNFN